MKHEKIPQHLKATAECCCWKYEQKHGKAKLDKIPKNPRTGGNASVSIPNTFSDFDTARYSNIAFQIPNIIGLLSSSTPRSRSDFSAALSGLPCTHPR